MKNSYFYEISVFLFFLIYVASGLVVGIVFLASTESLHPSDFHGVIGTGTMIYLTVISTATFLVSVFYNTYKAFDDSIPTKVTLEVCYYYGVVVSLYSLVSFASSFYNNSMSYLNSTLLCMFISSVSGIPVLMTMAYMIFLEKKVK